MQLHGCLYGKFQKFFLAKHILFGLIMNFLELSVTMKTAGSDSAHGSTEYPDKENFMNQKLKSAVKILVFVLVLLLPVQSMAQVMKTTIDLPLRARASSTSTKLGVIPKGTEINIDRTTGNWVLTAYAGKAGYSGLKYLTPTANTEMCAVTTDLRLRSGPGTSYASLLKIPKHTPIPVFERQGNWIKTVWSGKIGWVGVKYTKTMIEMPQLQITLQTSFRTGPGSSYSRIGYVPRSAIIPVLGTSGNWVKSWYFGRIGWISRSYLAQPMTSGFRTQALPDLSGFSNHELNWDYTKTATLSAFPELGGAYRYEDNAVHLTFDCGYENGYTAQYLDVLKANGLRARFYVTGFFIKTEPELVRRMLAEGHEVGNHTDIHPDSVALMEQSPQLVYDDMVGWEELFHDATGSYPSTWFYRAPSGIYSERTLALVQWMGYQSEFWEVALDDWNPQKQMTQEATMHVLKRDTKPGSIVLLHCVSSTNIKILQEYIDWIHAQSWTIATP